MTQNIYDTPQFFHGYSQLGRSRAGLAEAPEWPSLMAMVGDVRGRRIIDLGCGFGWFCRWARQNGAAHVLGLDVSENMLARALAEPPDPHIVYRRQDLETVSFAPPAEEGEVDPIGFDLAYSSLVFHYIVDLSALLSKLHGALVDGGRLVFSIEHPIFMAPTNPGWRIEPDGRKTWPLDHYGVEGPRVTDWLAKGVVKQHRTLGTILNLVIRSGFRIEQVEDFMPSPDQIAARPELAEERERPTFLLVAARRAGGTPQACG